MKTRLLQLITLSFLLIGTYMNANAQNPDEEDTTIAESSYSYDENNTYQYTSSSFFETLKSLFAQHGTIIWSVMDEPPICFDENVKKEIADVFFVPEMVLSGSISVGDVLCKIMETRYCGPSSECLDFYKIQYSSRFVDFQDYISKYPNSPYLKEAQKKYYVTKLVTLWRYAQWNGQKRDYECFLKTYQKFVDEYGKKYYEKDEVEEDCNLYYLNYEGYKRTSIEYYVKSAKKIIQEFEEKERIDDEAWAKARKSKSYEAYCDYYEQFPFGRHTEDVLDELRQYETPAWERSYNQNTREAFEDFLRHYPIGYHAQRAANCIIDLFQAKHHETIEKNFVSSLRMHDNFYDARIGIVNSCLKGYSYTLTLGGDIGLQKTLRPGETLWLNLSHKKNINILLESDHGDFMLSSIDFSGGIYQLYIQDMQIKEISIFDFMNPANLETNTTAIRSLIQETYAKYADDLQWIPK